MISPTVDLIVFITANAANPGLKSRGLLFFREKRIVFRLFHYSLFCFGNRKRDKEEQIEIAGVRPDPVVHPAGRDFYLVLRVVFFVDVNTA